MGALRWAHARTEDPAVVGPWLAEGAAQFAAALRAAGPDAPMWTPVPGGCTGFYARRPALGDDIEVLGDAELLDFWLERVGFG